MRRNYLINKKEIKIEQYESSGESEVLSLDDSVDIDNSKNIKSETDKKKADSLKKTDLNDSSSHLDEEDEGLPSQMASKENRKEFIDYRLSEVDNNKLAAERKNTKMEQFKEGRKNPDTREICCQSDFSILKKSTDSLIERFLAGENIDFPYLRKPANLSPLHFFRCSNRICHLYDQKRVWEEIPEKFKKKYYDEYEKYKREKYDPAKMEWDKVVKDFYEKWSYFAYYLIDMRFTHEQELTKKEFVDFCRDNWNNSTEEFKEKYRNKYLKNDFNKFRTELRYKYIIPRWDLKFEGVITEILYQKLRKYNENWGFHKIRQEIDCILEEAVDLNLRKICPEEREWIRKFLEEKKNPPKEKSSSSNTNTEKKEVAMEPAENTPSTNNISATKAKALPKKAKKTQRNPEAIRSDKKTKSLIIN
jgi:hypothetical protein